MPGAHRWSVQNEGLRATWKDLPTSYKQEEGIYARIVRLIINRMEFANVARTHRHSRPIFHRCSSSYEVKFDAEFSFFAMQFEDRRTCRAGVATTQTQSTRSPMFH